MSWGIAKMSKRFLLIALVLMLFLTTVVVAECPLVCWEGKKTRNIFDQDDCACCFTGQCVDEGVCYNEFEVHPRLSAYECQNSEWVCINYIQNSFADSYPQYSNDWQCCSTSDQCVMDGQCYDTGSTYLTDLTNRFICKNTVWTQCNPDTWEEEVNGMCCWLHEGSEGNRWDFCENNFCHNNDGALCRDISCVEDQCETEYNTEPGYTGPYIRKIIYPERDGMCENNNCWPGWCQTGRKFVMDDECNPFVDDSDGDGVIDENEPEECRNTPLGNLVDHQGCELIEVVPSFCNHLYGERDNVNIIITPCGWDANEQAIFEY